LPIITALSGVDAKTLPTATPAAANNPPIALSARLRGAARAALNPVVRNLRREFVLAVYEQSKAGFSSDA